MILAGDLGATNCRLAVFDTALMCITQRNYKCHQYNSFDEIISEFINDNLFPFQSACFAIPGPVRNGRCQLTDLQSWPVVDAQALSHLTHLPVLLLNDAQAHAYGLETLSDKEVIQITPGHREPEGNRAMLAIGTGIGQSALLTINNKIYAMATEGGNADFAPKNDVEIELMRFIQREYQQVSYEMILGGPGLIRIYEFLLNSKKMQSPAWISNRMKTTDKAVVISNAGLSKECAVCAEAMELFVSILASEAGNAALKFFSIGGLYIGGGMTPQIIDIFKTPLFARQFVRKDRLKAFLNTIPVYALLTSNTALRGAAWHALKG